MAAEDPRDLGDSVGARGATSEPSPRRWRSIVAVAALLAVGIGVDQFIDRPSDTRATTAPARGMPVAAPARALASSWFCAGGTAATDGAADVTVVVANPGRRELTGTVSVAPSAGEGRTVPLTVGGRDRAVLHLQDLVQAPYVAAAITLDGGEVAVEQLVVGPAGTAALPCASGASNRWYVASGSTAREDAMVLALYNPFPENAIADLSFTTDQGRAVPSDFQGIVVPGGALRMVNISDHVRRRDTVAATIATRSGRLVVDRLQLKGGANKSMSLALAAPGPAHAWYFPEGNIVDGVTEHFSVYNPGTRDAHVAVDLTLEQGAVEPFDLTVPAGEAVIVKAEAEERIPHGVPHSAVATVTSGPAVVVDRTITSVAPSSHIGESTVLGATQASRRWLLPVGAANDSYDEWVTLQNPTARAVTVSMIALAAGQPLALQDLQSVKLAAGRRQTVRLGDHVKRDDLSIVVQATGPIVIDRGLYRVDGPGISVTPGIPLR